LLCLRTEIEFDRLALEKKGLKINIKIKLKIVILRRISTEQNKQIRLGKLFIINYDFIFSL